MYGETHFITFKNIRVTTAQGPGFNGFYNWSLPTPKGHLSNLIMDNCEISYTNYNGLDEAISFRAIDSFEVKNCKVHDVQGGPGLKQKEGIDFKEGSSNGSIHDNEVYNAKVGIYIGDE